MFIPTFNENCKKNDYWTPLSQETEKNSTFDYTIGGVFYTNTNWECRDYNTSAEQVKFFLLKKI